MDNEFDFISTLLDVDHVKAERYSQLYEIALELNQLYDREMQKLPYAFNIIDQLHANENDHTKILLCLLGYKRNGSWPILKSFIDLALSLNDLADNRIGINNPSIKFNDEFIDGHIWEPNDYSFIIENKINWAQDQSEQIERYVNTDISRGIPKERIFVLYLTDNGSKEVSECSLTSAVKEILGNRFIKLNYRDHTLPWLKDEILPNCLVKEDLMTSAIKQYIDYLEGRFNIRQSQITALKNINIKIEDKLGIMDVISIEEKYRRLSDLKKEISDFMNTISSKEGELLSPIMNGIFLPKFKSKIKEKGLDAQIENSNNWTEKYAGISITPSNWHKFSISFEFDQPCLGQLIVGYHLSDNYNRDDIDFWKELQSKINQTAQFDNRTWIYRNFKECAWWNNEEAINMIFSDDMAKLLSDTVEQLYNLANDYAM